MTPVADARKPAASPAVELVPCQPCKGTGEVSKPVRVGRKRRTAGEQTGMCLRCWGAGEHAPR
ncbi:hypothetical protein GCM10018987_26510 [Streptomyces cremeus]